MKPFRFSLHVFRRDLRLPDNTALIAALRSSEQVLPVFILDERQVANPFFGENSFCFMLQSLIELDVELRQFQSQLYIFKGIPGEIIAKLTEQYPVEALFVNRDYTPFSRERDQALKAICMKKGIRFNTYADSLLTEPELVHKDDGTPYTVFTPFFKKARQLAVSQPEYLFPDHFYHGEVEGSSNIERVKNLLPTSREELRFKGGRSEGLLLLKKIENLENYALTRNLPAEPGTSLLSPHHKFGTISIRETYHRVKLCFDNEHPLIGELYWRDFFTHILFHFPQVLGNPFRAQYDSIEWKTDPELFDRWARGQTGFPIVDAGMRELVATGFMHNRVRMIVASFLVKDLHLDWRLGEQFFSRHLSDYDPAVNNGNWQWAASTGCDAQPYFRIFNPWSQQQKYDYQCVYIKQWVTELQSVPVEAIHNLYRKFPLQLNYPVPMVDHSEAAGFAKMLFKKV